VVDSAAHRHPFPQLKPMKDQPSFTTEELTAAFALLVPAEEARREAELVNQEIPEFDDDGVPYSPPGPPRDPRAYSEEFLDLLSLVSDDVAQRAWRLLGVTESVGRDRREALRRRLADRSANGA
jgi:hypothetical protein